MVLFTLCNCFSLEADPRRETRFEQLSSEDGLSQGTVNGILQDRTGFLWFGTQEGLNRYDGYDFKVYQRDSDNLLSLSNNWIMALAEGPTGDVWIGTEGGGLSRWRQSTDSFLQYLHDPENPESLSGDRVTSLTWDREGILWVGTQESGLNRLDPTTGVFQHFRHHPHKGTSLSHDHVSAIHEDREGNLWIGTKGGLNYLNKTAKDHLQGPFLHYRHDSQDPQSLSDDRVRTVLQDSKGDLWVGTENGLNLLNAQDLTFKRYNHDPSKPQSLSHDWVRSLFEDRSGRLWIGTDGGLNLWLPESDSFLSYHHDPGDTKSLGSGTIDAIFQDRGGVLWVSTVGAGVSKWDPNTWKLSHLKSDASDDGQSNNVLALEEDAEGALWIGTFGGGLERYDRRMDQHTRYLHDPEDESSLSDNRITALLHDWKGVLWAGSLAGGLNQFDAASQSFTTYRHDPERPQSLSSNGITTLYEDRREQLWVGTYGGGLNLHLGNGNFSHFRHSPDDPESLSNDRVSEIEEDAKGRLWVATDGGGLSRLDSARNNSKTFLRWQHDPEFTTSLSANDLLCIHVDQAGRLWVGTKGHGLDRLDDLDGEPRKAVFENYSKRDGLPSEMIWGIESDDEGYLWLSTNGGLSRLDPQTGQFKNYNVSHGAQGSEFNMGAHFRSPGGELLFGGVNGFNAFFPERLEVKTAPPPVVLTRFTKFNKEVNLGKPPFAVDEISLNYRDRFLTFEFAALDYTAPHLNQYRYMIDGFENRWIGLGKQRILTVSSLPSGNYVLRVQGSNNDGVWNEEGVALKIRVTPPFWKTWWFQTLGAMVTLGVIFLVYEVRVYSIRRNSLRLQALVTERTSDLKEAQAQLVRKERLAVLGELAGSVAHEIRNPLGVIKNAIYFLRLTQKTVDEKGQEHLNLIEREIQRSDRIIVELLDYAQDPSSTVGRYLVQKILSQALEEVEIPPNVHVEQHIDEQPLTVLADREQLEHILTHLLENALHAMHEGGDLRIHCRRQNGHVIAEITDTGSGIAEEDLSKVFEPLYTTKMQGLGLGLTLSQRYAEMNGGRIECESRVDQGSTFRLVLPAFEGSHDTV